MEVGVHPPPRYPQIHNCTNPFPKMKNYFWNERKKNGKINYKVAKPIAV